MFSLLEEKKKTFLFLFPHQLGSSSLKVGEEVRREKPRRGCARDWVGAGRGKLAVGSLWRRKLGTGNALETLRNEIASPLTPAGPRLGAPHRFPGPSLIRTLSRDLHLPQAGSLSGPGYPVPEVALSGRGPTSAGDPTDVLVRGIAPICSSSAGRHPLGSRFPEPLDAWGWGRLGLGSVFPGWVSARGCCLAPSGFSFPALGSLAGRSGPAAARGSREPR
jgi:hypothetical protein